MGFLAGRTLNQALIATYTERNRNCFVALRFLADIFGKVKLLATVAFAFPDESKVLGFIHSAANYTPSEMAEVSHVFLGEFSYFHFNADDEMHMVLFRLRGGWLQ